MGINRSLVENLEESLEELLEASRYCVIYLKSGPPWDDLRTGGDLGYPAAILLFSVVESIGSYFRKNKSFKIQVDGKLTTINNSGWEHFKILNSKYFNLELSRVELQMLYNQYRSSISHNAILGDGVYMYPSSEGTKFDKLAFAKLEDGYEPAMPILFVKELYFVCRAAVDMFKLDMHEIVPQSNQVLGTNQKK